MKAPLPKGREGGNLMGRRKLPRSAQESEGVLHAASCSSSPPRSSAGRRLQQPPCHPADQQDPAGRQEVHRRGHRLRCFRASFQAKTGEDPLAVFKKAMDNVRPTLEVKPKRVGGATYQVPMEVNSRRATTLAIRWIVDFSRKRKEHTMKRAPGRRDHGRRREHRRFREEARGPLQDGRVQPCVLALSLARDVN